VALGRVGREPEHLYLRERHRPDGANHDRNGVWAMAGLPGQATGEVTGLNLVDVGPSILSMYGIDAPEGAVGRSFL
jgi:predicted AlkP superfamily phosphohydrolase/phosphomutase